jgi:hypothetical protein
VKDIHVVRRSLYFRPVIDDNDRLGLPGMVLFRYATVTPFSVHFFFPERAVVLFREVLADGIDHEAGEGDVVVKHLSSGAVEMRVEGRGGVFRARLPRNALIDALGETLLLVPFGGECEAFDMDAELTAWMRGAA